MGCAREMEWRTEDSFKNLISQQGDPRWEQVECRNCDVNGDDVVSMRDIGIACNNFSNMDP